MNRITLALSTILLGTAFIGSAALAGQSLKLNRSYVWIEYTPSSAGSPPVKLPGSPATPIEVDLDAYGQGTWSESATQDGVTFIMQINVQQNQSAGDYDVGVEVYAPAGIFPDSDASVKFHPANLTSLPTFDLQPSMVKTSTIGVYPIVTFSPIQ